MRPGLRRRPAGHDLRRDGGDGRTDGHATFDCAESLRKVTIDLSQAHLWDITAVGALDKIVLKYRRQGVEVAVIGVSEASAHMLDRFALHDKDHAAFSAQGGHGGNPEHPTGAEIRCTKPIPV
ncbi:STAS domain-containing protein [Shinella sp. S4-D37]|uniref:STAS domain-containing protein n=1 Tax=Shinella sp. S4-D37 TaxID=3161999 RepID=UPI003467DE8D